MQDSAGKRTTVATSRIVQYGLVENTGADAATRPFLIDAWRNKVSTSAPIRSTP
jgi:hypothetical protein